MTIFPSLIVGAVEGYIISPTLAEALKEGAAEGKIEDGDLEAVGTDVVGLTDRDVGDLVGFLVGTRVGLQVEGATLGSKLGLDVG